MELCFPRQNKSCAARENGHGSATTVIQKDFTVRTHRYLRVYETDRYSYSSDARKEKKIACVTN